MFVGLLLIAFMRFLFLLCCAAYRTFHFQVPRIQNRGAENFIIESVYIPPTRAYTRNTLYFAQFFRKFQRIGKKYYAWHSGR